MAEPPNSNRYTPLPETTPCQFRLGFRYAVGAMVQAPLVGVVLGVIKARDYLGGVSSGASMLNLATTFKQGSLVELSARCGANPDQELAGIRPLLMVAVRGPYRIAETLLRHGAEIHDGRSNLVAEMADTCGHTSIRILIDKYAAHRKAVSALSRADVA